MLCGNMLCGHIIMVYGNMLCGNIIMVCGNMVCGNMVCDKLVCTCLLVWWCGACMVPGGSGGVSGDVPGSVSVELKILSIYNAREFLCKPNSKSLATDGYLNNVLLALDNMAAVFC